MVGQRLVELCADKLAERGASDQVDIVSFCEERLAAYNRVRLTSWFETRNADDLSLVGSYKDAPQGEWYASEERPNCKVRVGDLATGLDVDKKTVACGDELVKYDKCVLATGSYPFVPPIPGKDLPGVFVYRTIDDLEALGPYGLLDVPRKKLAQRRQWWSRGEESLSPDIGPAMAALGLT